MIKEHKVCVIGLGYVGLPLACLFATKYKTTGYDVNKDRIRMLREGHDATLETSDEKLRTALEEHGMTCTDCLDDIRDCNVYIVSVPTPVYADHTPNLEPLIGASTTVGKVIRQGDIVIYESTVYPGVTEEVCIPVIERESGLKFNEGFFAGYSPERINPSDKVHTVEEIVKVTSGSTPEVADEIDRLYASVLKNGTYKASSIKVAEACKVIENSQRDVNIAFVNELAKIFNAMGIDTNEVIDAASTKWNFQSLRPGLVGGHCISVDPYYLIQRAADFGVKANVISSSRAINDGMGEYVAEQLVKLMAKKGLKVKDSGVLVMGFTFKENCTDTRNTQVVNVIRTLREYTPNITVYDPWADADEVKRIYGEQIENSLPEGKKYDAAICTVAHQAFLTLNVRELLKEGGVIYDVKGCLPKETVDGRL